MRSTIAFLFTAVCVITAAPSLSQSIVTNDPRYQIHTDSNGISTSMDAFSPAQLYPKTTWRGDWIWLNPAQFAAYQNTRTEWGKNEGYQRQYTALFTKQFVLGSIPKQALLSITGDVFFRVYVNGVFVAHGPANVGNDFFDGVPPKHWFFNTHNIKGYLQQGENTIAVEVYSHYREISETSSGRGMLIADLDTGLNKPLVATDASWACAIDTAFSMKDGNFAVDGRVAQSGWSTASIVAQPKAGYLLQSKIPVPIRHRIEPVQVSPPGQQLTDQTLHSTEFTLDYGRNLTAYYGFEVMAHQNDTIRIYPFEKKDASMNRALTFVCKEGRNVFDAPYLNVFRYLKVAVNSDKGLQFKQLRTDFSSYPVNYAGSFECSDPFLTELWKITRWTTQLCMNDMFYDSPKHQEPIACTGDYLIESLINYYAFGDPWLTRQTLVKTALMLEKNQYDMFHTSYSLLWVQMLTQYYRHTGDLGLIRELVPHVNKLNQLFASYLDTDYLVSNAPDYMFMDWIKIGAFNAHHPPAVIGMGYMTAFYYKSLQDAAYLNQLVQQSAVSQQNLALAAKIKAGMNRLLWDPEQLRYKDGLPFRNHAKRHYFFPEDTAIVTYSPHVNTLAVLYDIAPKARQAAIMDYVLHQQSIDLQPYFMFFVLGAIEHVGAFPNAGLEQLRKWQGGINKETYTLKENWQDVTATGYGGDYSHAWGGSPLYYLSKNVLGVDAVNGAIVVRPFTGEAVSWANGTVPLAGGKKLSLAWKRQSAGKYEYTIDAPRNQKVYLEVPASLQQKGFILNGKRYPANTTRVALVSGKTVLELHLSL